MGPAGIKDKGLGEMNGPLYQQMKTRILDLIADGSYRTGDRLPPEPEIAEQFGVSRATANKAIVELVNEGWLSRKRRTGTFVLDRKQDATPSVSPLIIVYQPSLSNEDSYFQGLFWEIHDQLAEKGVPLRTLRQDGFLLPEAAYEADADPLIVIASPRQALDSLLDYSETKGRVILIGASWRGRQIVSIDSDNSFGAALAIRHLADLGHTRIGFIGAQPYDSNTIDRHQGFRSAMAGRGLELRPDYTVVDDNVLDYVNPGTDPISVLLSDPERPTAIFAGGSFVAMAVISVAHRLGLRVPEDLSIVGYDDPPFAVRATPPLTTVRQPLQQMARRAAELINSPSVPIDMTNEHYVFDPELVVRGTTTAPPRK